MIAAIHILQNDLKEELRIISKGEKVCVNVIHVDSKYCSEIPHDYIFEKEEFKEFVSELFKVY